MAYTGFPATYPQTYPQSYPQFQQQNNPIIWMQGIEAARAYPVAPNGQVVLFDSEQQCIYLLSGTNTDIPTRQDLNALQGQIDALKQQIERLGHESTLSADAVTAEQQPASTVSAIQTGIPG